MFNFTGAYSKLLKFLIIIGSLFLLLALLTLGFGRAFTSISIGIAGGISILLFIKEPKAFFKQLYSNPVSWFCILFVAIFYISMLYSSAPLQNQLGGIRTYNWYLFPIVLIPLAIKTFGRNDRWIIAAFNCLIINSIALSLIAIMSVHSSVFYHGVISIYHYRPTPESPLMQHTDAGFFTAFAAYLSFLLLWRYKKYWPYYLSCFLLLSYYCLFINTAKTGYLIYVLLAVIFCIQQLSRRPKYLLAAMIVLLLAFGLVYKLSPQLTRLHHLAKIVSVVQQSQDTSFGIRYAELKLFIKIWKQAPIIGHGVGYAPLNSNPKLLTGKRIRTRDITQYADTMVQIGLIGLLIFIGLLVSMFCYGLKLKSVIVSNVAVAFTIVTAFFALISSNFAFDPDSYYIVLMLTIVYLSKRMYCKKIDNI